VRIVTVNPLEPRPDRLEIVVRVLESGFVVALTTETFYGLAADAFRADALERVNHLKGKPPASPVLLLVAGPGQVAQVAGPLPAKFHELAAAFWPGPLTLVVPALERVPREVTAGGGSVAVRVSGLPLPRRIAEELGRPISGVSANLHGRPPCRTAREVVAVFGDAVDLVLDGGPTAGGASSTIVDLVAYPPRLVREGLLPSASLLPFLPDLQGIESRAGAGGSGPAV